MKHGYKHILVPLDGSELAESALADALGIAALNQAKITLFQAVKPAEHVLGANTRYPAYLDQQWAGQKAMAEDYLAEVCHRLSKDQDTLEMVVKLGTAAESIIDYAQDQSVDLIVMATHGRSGLGRWVYGSVADKVLRGADVPVLLVRAKQKQGAV